MSASSSNSLFSHFLTQYGDSDYFCEGHCSHTDSHLDILTTWVKLSYYIRRRRRRDSNGVLTCPYSKFRYKGRLSVFSRCSETYSYGPTIYKGPLFVRCGVDAHKDLVFNSRGVRIFTFDKNFVRSFRHVMCTANNYPLNFFPCDETLKMWVHSFLMDTKRSYYTEENIRENPTFFHILDIETEFFSTKPNKYQSLVGENAFIPTVLMRDLFAFMVYRLSEKARRGKISCFLNDGSQSSSSFFAPVDARPNFVRNLSSLMTSRNIEVVEMDTVEGEDDALDWSDFDIDLSLDDDSEEIVDYPASSFESSYSAVINEMGK